MLSSINNRRMALVTAILALLVISVWIIPKLSSLVFQVIGGRDLKYALSHLPSHLSDGLACGLSLVNDVDASRILESAEKNLRRSVRIDDNNSHSYLLLGKVNCFQENYDEAIISLQKFTNLRPDNPVGHLELGFAYLTKGDISQALNQTELSGSNLADVREFSNKNYVQLGDQLPYLLFDPLMDAIPSDFENYSVVVDSFSSTEAWTPYSINSNGEFTVQDGVLIMGYLNDSTQRDVFTYAKVFDIPIEKYNRLDISTRASPRNPLNSRGHNRWEAYQAAGI